MKVRWDGSIQSNNVPLYDRLGIPREDYGLYRCMVIGTTYIDDKANISMNSANPEVLYEVIILGGAATGQTLSFCRLAPWISGNDNYSERTLTKTTKDVSKVKLSDHDGDVVYVQFNQGHDAYPVIVAMAKGLKNPIAAKKSEGPRFIQQFNGFLEETDNKGQLHWSMFGGETKDGRFKPSKTSIIKEEWLKDEKLVRTYKSGMTVTEDGKNDKVLIKTSGGSQVSIDGKGSKISIKAGSAEVLIDGGSGKISIKGDMVDLGSSVSDFVTKFTELASAFNAHTHMGNLGAPTSPPMAPLLSSVGSQTVKVQS